MGPAFGSSKYTYSTGGHQCAPYTNSLSGQIHIILLLVICIIIPSAVMLYCYSKLYIMIHKHANRVTCNEATSENNQARTLSSVASHMIQTLIIMMLQRRVVATKTVTFELRVYVLYSLLVRNFFISTKSKMAIMDSL